MNLRIAGTEEESIVDGPGIRYTIFTQGCLHGCPGCHNPDTHDVHGGIEVDIDELYEDIISNPILTGVTLSGGEPFLQASKLIPLVTKIKSTTKLDVVCYTGYTIEQLFRLSKTHPSVDQLLKSIDILIDGPFMEDRKDLTLKFRGSSNQRILFLQNGKVDLSK